MYISAEYLFVGFSAFVAEIELLKQRLHINLYRDTSKKLATESFTFLVLLCTHRNKNGHPSMSSRIILP